MSIQIESIATTYKGIRMRSRLEAKWAAMFDAFDWQWEYEPPGYAGWIPDFQIRTSSIPLLVEVKPAASLSDQCAQEAVCDIRRCLDGVDCNALILGIGPMYGTRGDESLLGWMPESGGDAFWWDFASVGEIDGGKICLCHSSGSYVCRVCGDYNGSCANMDANLLRQCWAKACNQFQWKPK